MLAQLLAGFSGLAWISFAWACLALSCLVLPCLGPAFALLWPCLALPLLRALPALPLFPLMTQQLMWRGTLWQGGQGRCVGGRAMSGGEQAFLPYLLIPPLLTLRRKVVCGWGVSLGRMVGTNERTHACLFLRKLPLPKASDSKPK